MLVKNWHRDGKQTKRERLAPAKLKSVKQRTANLRRGLKSCGTVSK
jgi:hypothetical protein